MVAGSVAVCVAAGARVRVNYNSDLFDRPRIELMMRDLAAILDAASVAPETPLARLALPPISTPLSLHQERLWFVDKFERGVLYAEAEGRFAFGRESARAPLRGAAITTATAR